jgi:hypothetical protein
MITLCLHLSLIVRETFDLVCFWFHVFDVRACFFNVFLPKALRSRVSRCHHTYMFHVWFPRSHTGQCTCFDVHKDIVTLYVLFAQSRSMNAAGIHLWTRHIVCSSLHFGGDTFLRACWSIEKSNWRGILYRKVEDNQLVELRTLRGHCELCRCILKVGSKYGPYLKRPFSSIARAEIDVKALLGTFMRHKKAMSIDCPLYFAIDAFGGEARGREQARVRDFSRVFGS